MSVTLQNWHKVYTISKNVVLWSPPSLMGYLKRSGSVNFGKLISLMYGRNWSIKDSCTGKNLLFSYLDLEPLSDSCTKNTTIFVCLLSIWECCAASVTQLCLKTLSLPHTSPRVIVISGDNPYFDHVFQAAQPISVYCSPFY